MTGEPLIASPRRGIPKPGDPDFPVLVVKERACNECLFTGSKIVDDARRDEILEDLREEGYFICHKSSLEGGRACCRGFFDADLNPQLRLCKIMDRRSGGKCIKFVE